MRRLEAKPIAETADRLARRVAERFPESGLSKVAAELAEAARHAESRAESLERPHWPLRGLSWALSAALVFGVGSIMFPLLRNFHLNDPGELQGLEAAANIALLLGAGILWTGGLETRLRRDRALGFVHELKALAHVVDMHQLTKDPETVSHRGLAPTASSPKRREMTPPELHRYLDYCSECFSLIGKTAALYAQSLHDPVLLEAVDGVEDLTTGLARKVWQKIALLER